MRVAVFGHGVPWGIFVPFDVPVEDVTLRAARPAPQIAAYLEPFMDPFARAVLDGLAGGAFDGVDLLVFLRESPGALPAFHYACDFARRGLLPADAPALHLLNLVPSNTPAAHRFNLTEIDRLADVLGSAGGARSRFEMPPLPPLTRGAEVAGPRQALLGAPLGNTALQEGLARLGPLVLDQQAEDAARAAAGDTIDAALAAQAANPFAARQPGDLYLSAVASLLAERQVERVLWQVDAHDDLWGWLMPDLRALAEKAGVAFVDLGVLPRRPSAEELSPVLERLAKDGAV